MALLDFLVSIFGATMLLLFAVRLVQNSIERVKGPEFRRLLTQTRSPYRGAAVGFVLAILLQSSAAVAVLTSGFSVGGALSAATGLAIILGADLGSAIVVRMLSLDLHWLAPILLGIGGWLYLKFSARNIRQVGGILLGIALIIVALGMLRATIEPLQSSDLLPAIESSLAADPVLAFVLGAVLAFVMHSSVAAILMFGVAVSAGALSLDVGIVLVLGANLGGALVPLWITRTMPIEARRAVTLNVVLRGLTAATFALIFARGWLAKIDFAQIGLIGIHVYFNAVLLIYLPFVGLVAKLATRLMPEQLHNQNSERSMLERSLLDEQALKSASTTIISLRREVVRVTQLTEQMTKEVLTWFTMGTAPDAELLKRDARLVHNAGQAIRQYVTRISAEKLSKSEFKRMRDLADYALSLEAAADIVVQRLLNVVETCRNEKLRFSDNGRKEIQSIAEQLLQNMSKSYDLLVTDDVEAARELFRDKDELGALVGRSRKRHLMRLKDGLETSVATSELHLECLSAMKELNARTVANAYPILKREGQLLQSRLILEG
ncbi:Na/Pi cotransporter family protein [Maritalea porphyrae]|uniref:Na/Pi cotransporter family protein n=1 Tax=Maritalea porphyrae TaxID=880732 RepID=UPI0022AE79A3|nr:Na/Pi cotransporter family protein [Maritalea porphyrae]MCZ4273457.1 Na/Pi cotransporter family protein [Maritalea porphyrae]